MYVSRSLQVTLHPYVQNNVRSRMASNRVYRFFNLRGNPDYTGNFKNLYTIVSGRVVQI